MENQKLVYEIPWLINSIYKESDRLATIVVYTEDFEERCIGYIGQYLRLSPKNKENKSYLMRMIKRKSKEVREEYAATNSINMSELEIEDDYGDRTEFDPMDVLADVESEVIAKEMTALLAQGDHRKKEILGYWSIGNTNHALISRLLAQTLGGNKESHRKAINRFRKDCHEYLESTGVAV